MKNKITNKIFDFFVNSNDFNGIPLRQISVEFGIDYKASLDLIKELVIENKITIQSSTNPHIIGFQKYPIDIQIKILDDAKNTKVTKQKMGEITFASENTDFPICLYPTKQLLESKRDLTKIRDFPYTLELSLSEPQLKPIYFEIEALDRYFNDPRYDFKFEDYSGRISYKYDENDNPIVREVDKIFIKTFGLGFDSKDNRVAVVYLRYLNGLTKEHQIFWKSRELNDECRMLKEYYDNTIQGSWTFSYSIFTGFIGELKLLNDLSVAIFDKPLFSKNFDEENRPKEFTFFFTPTLKNYHSFVSLLDKMMSENINRSFFKDKVELFDIVEIENNLVERKQKGTIRLLEEWLQLKFNAENQDATNEIIFKPFRKVRAERQSPAHKISTNVYDKIYTEKQKDLIDKSYQSIRALRHIFQQHRKAKNVTIPDWLENGEIYVF